MDTLPYPQLVDRLRQRLEAPLPGADAQVQMAPVYRTTSVSTEGRDCREAGVLALLYPSDDVPYLVLTVRRDDLPDHPGQISFPGGQRENGESLRRTALREAHEEVNLNPVGVDVIGALTPLYIPPSNFCVHPYVGALSGIPDLRPTDAEVASILHVPLPHLLDEATVVREMWTLRGFEIEVPFFAVDEHKVWGATAMMLSELVHLCRDVIAARIEGD